MQDDAVEQGWMTAAEFANAVGYGQITPGPVTHTVALVGWAAAGPAGRAAGDVLAFAPSFAIVTLGGRGLRAPALQRRGARLPRRRRPAAIGRHPRRRGAAGRRARGAWQLVVLAAAALALLAGRAALWALLGRRAGGPGRRRWPG